MNLRKANELDIDNLIELMQKADNRSLEWAKERTKGFILTNKDKMILVAEDNSKLVGFIGVKKYEDNQAREFLDLSQFAWIAWTAVLPEYRNKKIGSELLKYAEKYIKDYNKVGLILDCRKKVINFYTKNGYNIAGKYIDNQIPRYVMSKELT